ncbi:MAG: DUF885 domain-containing protein [Gemmatimonadaceae bacterium]
MNRDIMLVWAIASVTTLGAMRSLAAESMASSGDTPQQSAGGRDSTSSARTLSRVMTALQGRSLETSISARLRAGLPIVRLPDISLAAAVKDGKFAANQLATLSSVRESALTAEERLTLRVLRWQLALDAEAPRYYWLSLGAVTPNATIMQDVARAFETQRIASPDDVVRYANLLSQVAPVIDSMRAGLVARAARGIVLPKDEIPIVITLMRGYRKAPDSSTFIPSADRITGLDAGEALALRESAARVIASAINPAFDRLLTYLSGAYLARAPNAVGLSQYPGGRAYYRYLVRLQTTMEITPSEVHRIGLREVARIDSAMAAIRAEVGFTGTALEFHAQLRKDPRLFARTPDEVRDRLMAYVARVRPAVPRFFNRTPHAEGDARRLDPRLEPSMTFGFYAAPTASDSMGHYYFNGSKLEDRSMITAGALIAHELIPGHHFQIGLQQENAALSLYRQNSFYGAYTEGWGEYASALAGEMGMYQDPYERYGRLFMEMFLACRLVVDTGMNEYGWSRDSAMAFMRPRVAESQTQLLTETLRYSADIPAQALAYKMGSIEIRRLRDLASKSLGSRFDIRAFHDVILSSGSLPMTVLREKVRAWIATERERQ